VPKRLITTAPATARAHGIGAAAVGGETAATTSAAGPQSVPSAAAAEGSAARHTADAAPAQAGPAPAGGHASAAGGGLGGSAGRPGSLAAGPAHAAETAHGRTPEETVEGGGPADAGHETVADPSPPRAASGLPQRRRRQPSSAAPGRFTAPGPASPPAPEADADADAPVPGMWMADLQSGLSGEGRKTSAPRSNRETTSDEGE